MFVTSISIRLFKAITLKNGKHPIVLQVIYRNPSDKSSNVRRIRLGFAAHPEQWDKDRFRNSANRGREYNNQFDGLIERAWDIYDKHFINRHFNYKKFAELLNRQVERIDLKALMQEVRTELSMQGRVGTVMSYQCAVDSIYNYAGENKLYLNEVDSEWLRAYEKYNLAKGNKCNVYMRSLKSLYGRAVERGYIEPNEMPFKTKYQPRGYCFAHLSKVVSKKLLSKRIKTLSIEEMSSILSYKPSSEPYMRAMDYFLFSYYNMGVDLKDIALMSISDIKNGLWYHRREKSGVRVLGKPITGLSMEIIQRHYVKGNPYIFNDLLGDKYSQSEQAIKRRIRDVCSNLTRRYKVVSEELGLDGYFTFNTARHTAATICTQLGGDLNSISKLLNHKSIQTTNHYIGLPDVQNMTVTLSKLILNQES